MENKEKLIIKNNNIYNMEGLEGIKLIKDNSINLVLIDPPYNIGKDKRWDKWKKKEDYIEFMGNFFLEFQRVLKPNGSMYFFHNDMEQISRLMEWLRLNTNFKFNSFIVWEKPNFRCQVWKNPSDKSKLRSWFSIAEYCLYYTFEDGTGLEKITTDINNFKTLRNYFKELQKYIGLNRAQINKKMGDYRAEHCFEWNVSQWALPTEETYNKLIKIFNIDKWEGFRPYEGLRQEYEGLRQGYEGLRQKYESERYTHNLDKEHNNIWKSNNYNSGWVDGTIGLHSCQKPLDILERIIKTSSNENDVILDCFLGSGSTAVAAINTDRNYIGIELDKAYFEIAEKRIEEANKIKGDKK